VLKSVRKTYSNKVKVLITIHRSQLDWSARIKFQLAFVYSSAKEGSNMSYLKTGIVQAGLAITLMSIAALPAVAGQDGSSSVRQGLPGRRISGGTRSECMAGSAPVVALNPTTNLGETVSDSPSVYFIIPELEDVYPLEFSLRDSEGNSIYEQSLNTRENRGVVGIQLPPQSLEKNQDYQWKFSVVCDAQDPSQRDTLSGWLRQVEPEEAMANSLNTAESYSINAGLEVARSYQESGLWNDAISTLAELREQYPTARSVYHSWNQLLQALEVETLVGESVAMTR